METTTGYKIMKVDYPGYLTDIGQLRYIAWMPVSGFEKSLIKDAVWTDLVDPIAVHWVMFDGDILIAAARVSFYDEVENLPSYHRMPKEAIATVQTPVAFLSRMVVHPEYQNQGLAKIMDEIRMAYILEQGAKSIVGEPVTSRMQRFNSYGFNFYPVLSNAPELAGVPLHLMIKNLTE